MSESVSTQANGLRTYRPPLAGLVFASEDTRTKVAHWIEGVATGNTSRALLITGGYGLGKTTLAKALCEALGVHENDMREVNCGAVGGVDHARSLVQQLEFRPSFGTYRIYLLDEIHKLTKDAQSAFLTPIENMLSSSILIGCTSDPELLDPALRQRFFEINLQPYSEDQIAEALENLPVPPSSKEIVNIARVSNGNMRQAISLAEGGLSQEDAKIQAVNAVETFYTLLMGGEFTALIYVLTRVNGQERKLFFQRVLHLLEGTYLMSHRQTSTLSLSEKNFVQKFIIGSAGKFNVDDVARYYRDLASLQERPIENTKAWVFGLMLTSRAVV